MSMIVVGVDGSETGRRALIWGLQEAALRSWSVAAVHAYATPFLGTEYVPTPSPVLDLAPSAFAMLETEVHAARQDAGGVNGVKVEPVIAPGHAAQLLMRTAVVGDLLVVGSRGRGGFAGLLLGSTSQQVAAHADCTVVVVR